MITLSAFSMRVMESVANVDRKTAVGYQHAGTSFITGIFI